MNWVRYSLLLYGLMVMATTQAQPAFRSIDTLLFKNFEAVDARDSVYYLSLLHVKKIIPAKGVKNHSDSLKCLKPFFDRFSEMVAELQDLAGSTEIEVKYESYTSGNTPEYDARLNGKLLLQVTLLINNTFTVKVPMVIVAQNGIYTIEYPMMVMFAD